MGVQLSGRAWVRTRRALLAATAGLLAGLAGASAPAAAPGDSAVLTVDTGKPGATIDPNIYGQFVEHLGRGVYEGIWVGPDTPSPMCAASAAMWSPRCAR